MKTKIGLLLCTCLYAFNTKAQFFGQEMFVTPFWEKMSSAQTTRIHTSGFLSAANNDMIGNTNSVYIRKINSLGTFVCADPDFYTGYLIHKDVNCTTPTIPNVCYGVTAIETGNAATPTNASNYAFAATCAGQTSGVFLVFTTLDLFGNVVNKSLINFPSTASAASRPYLIESPTVAGKYYITGSYRDASLGKDVMYILCVGVGGTVTWSRSYQSGSTFTPYGVVESPYNPTELVVVGIALPDPTKSPFLALANEGFFMKVNNNTGNLISCFIYGEDTPTIGACNEFHCITAAASMAGGSNGYVIGGHSDPTPSNPSFGYSWLIKLDPNGNVIWNKMIGAQTIVQYDAVLERSLGGGGYEYYASGPEVYPTVVRVNDNGTLPVNHKYEYTGVTVAVNGASPILLTDLNLGSPNDGIQVYTADPSNNTNSYFVKAYFSGNSGCNENITGDVESPGPNQKYGLPVTVSAGPTNVTCAGFDVIKNYVDCGMVPTIYCGATFLGIGSNVRLATGLQQNQLSGGSVTMGPNPTADKAYMSLETVVSDQVTVNLYNGAGQHIQTLYKSTGGSSKHTVEINLGALGLAGGVYFVHTTVNDNTQVDKLIYSK